MMLLHYFLLSAYFKSLLEYLFSRFQFPSNENYTWCPFINVFFRVRLVERGSPHGLPLMESGKVRYIMSTCTETRQTTVALCYKRWVFFFFEMWSYPVVDSSRSEGDHCQYRDERTLGRLPFRRGNVILLDQSSVFPWTQFFRLKSAFCNKLNWRL